jgi:hypothetical protein
MSLEYLAFIAGLISSLIFVGSNVPMLLKAYRTRDMRSYSWLNIILINAGNLIYWLYIVSLPPGPVWVLHTFYTIASGLMLTLCLRLRSCNKTR